MMNFLSVFCLLILMQVCRTAPLSCDEKTQYSKDGKCCNLCPKGSKLKEECTSNTETQCDACGAEEYQPKSNREKNCMVHRYCDQNAGFITVSEGSNTKNTECRCMDTLHCSGEACETCVKNSFCPPGQRVKIKSNGITDTQCENCPERSFSNVSSLNEVCTPWTRCEDLGQVEEKAGSAKQDAVCGPEKITPHATAYGLGIGLSVFCIIAVIIFMFLYKKHWCNKKKVQNPDPQKPEEDHLNPMNKVVAAENDEDFLSACQPVQEGLSDRNLPVQQEHGKDSHMSEEATDSIC